MHKVSSTFKIHLFGIIHHPEIWLVRHLRRPSVFDGEHSCGISSLPSKIRLG